jgi:hypothetical protein
MNLSLQEQLRYTSGYRKPSKAARRTRSFDPGGTPIVGIDSEERLSTTLRHSIKCRRRELAR